MEPPHVLLQRSTPRDRHGQKQCVKARIVESLTDVTACGHDDTRRVLNRQFLHEPGAFFHSHPALQHENSIAVLAQSDAEPFNMLSPAGQHQW